MASIEYVVNATGNLSAFLEKAGLTADHLDSQLSDLSKRIATPEVDLKDTKFTLGMVNAAKRLDKLSAMVADPKVEVDTEKAQLEILRVNAMLDRLDAKHVTATVKVDVDRSALSRLRSLFGGGGGGGGLGGLFGGGAGGAGGGIGGILNAVPVSGQAIGAGALGLLGAAVGPALLPTLLGGGVGAVAVGGGAALGSAAEKQLQALTKSLSSGTTAADKAKNKAIRQQMAQIQKQNAGPLGILGGIQDIGAVGKDVFSQALTARPVTAGPGGPVRGQSFLQGLLPVFKQIQGFIKSIGPGLGDLFRASLPFLKVFVGFMEQLGKTLLPVITTSLKQMQPFLPLISQGLVVLINGLAGMIQAIGPRGMKAAADIFVGLCHIMGEALILLGQFANGAAVAIDTAAKWIHKTWRTLQHNTAVIFDGIRHEIAHVWDIIYNNTIGAVLRIWHDVIKYERNLRHDIASTFDTIRHDIATAWDTIWRNTVTRVRNGITDVINWLKGLPARAVKALFGLGHGLAAFATSAFNEMWNAIKNVAGSIWNWLTSWVSRLPGWLKHLLGIKSPSSVFYDIGRQMMLGLFHGIKDHAHHARDAAQAAAGGAPGFGVAPNGPVQQYARQLLNAYGWGSQWPQFNALVMAESGWRWNATNPSSGAYGIPQALPPGKMGSAGRDWLTNPYTQLRWMMGYIHDRWTNPAGAWANEVANHWYGAGLSGGIFSRPTLIGVGERGPERVDVTPVGRRQGTGPLVVIEHLHVREAADVDLLARRLSFAMDA